MNSWNVWAALLVDGLTVKPFGLVAGTRHNVYDYVAKTVCKEFPEYDGYKLILTAATEDEVEDQENKIKVVD